MGPMGFPHLGLCLRDRSLSLSYAQELWQRLSICSQILDRVNQKPVSEFGFKPSGLGRHDLVSV